MKRCLHKSKLNEQNYKFSINLKKTTKGNVLYTLLYPVNLKRNIMYKELEKFTTGKKVEGIGVLPDKQEKMEN